MGGQSLGSLLLFAADQDKGAATTEFALNGEQVFYLFIISLVAVVLVVLAAFYAFKDKGSDTIWHTLFSNESMLLRILTIIIVVWATCLLASMGQLKEGVTALFGSIVGYVFGSLTARTRKPPDQTTPPNGASPDRSPP